MTAGRASLFLGVFQFYHECVTSRDVEQQFPSTTFEWRKVRIRQRPEGQRHSTRSKSGFLRLFPQPRRREVRMTVVHRGGAESWWLVKARGEHQVFPGHVALEDVMARVLSER